MWTREYDSAQRDIDISKIEVLIDIELAKEKRHVLDGCSMTKY